jgi:hypothetical protein
MPTILTLHSKFNENKAFWMPRYQAAYDIIERASKARDVTGTVMQHLAERANILYEKMHDVGYYSEPDQLGSVLVLLKFSVSNFSVNGKMPLSVAKSLQKALLLDITITEGLLLEQGIMLPEDPKQKELVFSHWCDYFDDKTLSLMILISESLRLKEELAVSIQS